jgi:hypothetical protein
MRGRRDETALSANHLKHRKHTQRALARTLPRPNYYYYYYYYYWHYYYHYYYYYNYYYIRTLPSVEKETWLMGPRPHHIYIYIYIYTYTYIYI